MTIKAVGSVYAIEMSQGVLHRGGPVHLFWHGSDQCL